VRVDIPRPRTAEVEQTAEFMDLRWRVLGLIRGD
jgi:hypothetical protein